MNPNKLYCRNGAQTTASTSSMSSGTSSAIGCGNSSIQDYIGCGSIRSSADFSCKELLSRNGNSKSVLNHRVTNSGNSFGGSGSSTSGYCSSNSSGTGNYINVMPVPMGSLQYHRRKITTQDYQPRLYYNTTDYRSRDDYYSLGATGGGSCGGGVSGRMTTSSPSPSPSLQLQNPPHQHQQQNQITSHHHNPLPHQHHQQQLQQQQQQQQQHQQQQHISQQQQHLHHHQQQQQQHTHHPISHVHQMQHHHQSVCSPSSAIDSADESFNLVSGGSNCRLMTGAHNHNNVSNSSNEQVVAPTAVSSIGTIGVPGPPLMYTVHRVVTTAQIQTATGNTYASSSSVSSVVSAVRNEPECIVAPVTSKTSPGCPEASAGLSGMVAANVIGDGGNSLYNNNTITGGGGVTSLRSSPGISTNFLPHPQKCNNTSEVQQLSSSRISNTNFAPTALSSNTRYITGAKSSSSISRPLQNVIPTCVYLMSRVAVHMEIEGTAHCPTQVMLAAALGCEELGIANKLLAQSIFGLWMTSTLLEIQLKSHHRPYVVRVAWKSLLDKFCHNNPVEKKFDEPMIMLKRNVFFSKRDEEKIKDHRILELLYEEAKYNVLSGRYVMEPVHSLMLGGIQARIELGPFNSHTHTISFFRENQSRFLPQHVAKSTSWSWLPVSRKNSAEVKLLEQFKRVPQTATTRKLMRKYLEFCWALPFYGAAFFHGQVEQPVRGLLSLVNHKDVDILVAVNERGVFIIDPDECTLLVGLRYEDLSWDFAKPSAIEDPDCLTCIFLQFDAVENGIQISKLMQIFSKQAAMIDALISHFSEHMRKRKIEGNPSEQLHDEPNPIQNNGNGVLCNKLSRLTLATFDEEGRCIGQMGSLSISY